MAPILLDPRRWACAGSTFVPTGAQSGWRRLEVRRADFVVAADNVLLRTAAGNEVARCALNEPVAFQVDQVDEFLQSGWSVLVTGVAEELPAELLRSLDIGRTPDPWPAGLRSLFLQIPIMAVTGRRVHPA